MVTRGEPDSLSRSAGNQRQETDTLSGNGL